MKINSMVMQISLIFENFQLLKEHLYCVLAIKFVLNWLELKNKCKILHLGDMLFLISLLLNITNTV